MWILVALVSVHWTVADPTAEHHGEDHFKDLNKKKDRTD